MSNVISVSIKMFCDTFMHVAEYRRMDCHIIYVTLFGILSCVLMCLYVFFCCVVRTCFIFSSLMVGSGSMKCMYVYLYYKQLNNYTT